MKKFSFRLDSVLRFRIAQRELEHSRMATMLAEQKRMGDEVEKLRTQRNDAVACLQSAREFQAIELRSLSAYLVGASGREQMLREQMARQAELLARQRERLHAAERNVKLLEKLKTARLEEWQREFHRDLEAAAEDAWRAAHGSA